MGLLPGIQRLRIMLPLMEEAQLFSRAVVEPTFLGAGTAEILELFTESLFTILSLRGPGLVH